MAFLISGTDKFEAYLRDHQHEVRFDKAEGYYPVDVVADAYSQGFNDGQKKGKEQLIKIIKQKTLDDFKKRSNQVYILTTKIISQIKGNGFNVDSFFMDLFAHSPRVIVVVNDDSLVNDEFVTEAYKQVHSAQEIFSKIFTNDFLDISIMGSSNVDQDCLRAEGFGYSEIYRKDEKEERTSKKKS